MQKGEDGKPGSLTLFAIGTAILWFGWFGFNGGSALAANGKAAIAFVNTALAGGVTMLAWLAISWKHIEHPSFAEALTGAVAGFVAITPAAGYVSPWAAVLIGLAAAFVCYGAVQFRRKKGLDDALDVVGVHGVGGILGSLLVGVFAQQAIGGVDGLVAGNAHQLLVQLIGVLAVGAYSAVITFVLLKLINKITPIRASEALEQAGLDTEFHEEA
jgi:Amt family ammonium transporter